MEHQFWHERWEIGDLGFHQDDYNPPLLRHWRGLDIVAGSRVFVPLCGKSMDMLWLARQGYEVLGVELSEIAVRSFFDENGLDAAQDRVGPFNRYRSDRIQILCGDFFLLTPELLQDVTAVFDRASLIALPAAMRSRYVAKLKALLRPAVKTLLVTLGHEDGLFSAPPHAVYDDEVMALYQPWCEVEFLETSETVVKGHTCPQSAYLLRAK